MMAALRISMRSIRKFPWRSSIVVALITLPVAVLVAVLAMQAGERALNEEATLQRLAGAQAIVNWNPVTFSYDDADLKPAPLEAQDAARLLREELGETAEIEQLRRGQAARSQIDGTVETIDWVEAADRPSDPLRSDPLRSGLLTDGRWPQTSGEVVVAGGDWQLGDRIQLELPPETVTVVGEAAFPIDERALQRTSIATLMLAAEGTFPETADLLWQKSQLGQPQLEFHVWGADQSDLDRLAANQMSSGSPSWFVTMKSSNLSQSGEWPAIGISTFGFAWCGLVAASALAIGARRRRRELGLLATNGAAPRQLRLAVVADGFVLGTIGGVLGLAIGIGAAALFDQRTVGPPGVPITAEWAWSPLVLLAPMLGCASATLAGALAGRGVARQPVIDLLAGRSPATGEASTKLVVGLGAAAASFVLGAAAGAPATTGLANPILQISSGLCGAVALLAIPASLITALPHWSRNRKVAIRTAAADLAHHGTRTIAATGAIAVTLSGATFLSVGERIYNENRDEWAIERERRSLSTHSAYLTGDRQKIVDGILQPAGLTPEQQTSIIQLTGVNTTLLRKTSPSATSACAANALEILESDGEASWSGIVNSEGCTPVEAFRVDQTALAAVSGPAGEVLTSGNALLVSWSLNTLPGLESPTLQVGETSIPLTALDVDSDSGQQLGRGLAIPFSAGGYGLFSVLIPESIWTPELDATAIDVAALEDVRSRPYQEWEAILAKLPSGSASYVGPASAPWSNGQSIALGGAIVLLTLLVLALALVLVRIESRHEETVLAAQGAQPSLIARICGWRATLITLIAAVPAVVLSLAFVWIAGGKAFLPHPASLFTMLVGLPLLAGMIFGLAGLRRIRPDLA